MVFEEIRETVTFPGNRYFRAIKASAEKTRFYKVSRMLPQGRLNAPGAQGIHREQYR